MPKDISPYLRLRLAVGQYSDAGRKPPNKDFQGAVPPEGGALRLKGITIGSEDAVGCNKVMP